MIIEECNGKRRTEIFARVYVYARVRTCTSRVLADPRIPRLLQPTRAVPQRGVGGPPLYLVVHNGTHTDTHTRARPPRSGLREWRQAVPDGGGRVSKAGRSATDTHTHVRAGRERTVGRTRACVPEARERRPRACSPPLPLELEPTYSRIRVSAGPVLHIPHAFSLPAASLPSLLHPVTLLPPAGPRHRVSPGVTRTQADAPRQPSPERSVRVPRGDAGQFGGSRMTAGNVVKRGG